MTPAVIAEELGSTIRRDAVPARRADHRVHPEDERKLIDVLHRLTDDGNTVVVIEHELDLIKNADQIIDLGPDGGENGGVLVALGTPDDVARTEASYLGSTSATCCRTST